MTILRLIFLTLIAAVLAAGPAQAQDGLSKRFKDLFGSSTETKTSLSEDEIATGLKDALRVATATVVDQLGRADGFYGDPDIRIPLPSGLQKANNLLSKVGLGGYGDELEQRINRAAERATPEAKALFLGAIKDMTLDDARKIYQGPDDAATRYFQDRMSPELAVKLKPIVDEAMQDVGAIEAYESLIGRYRDLPLVPDARTDISTYAVGKTMDGIFHYVAVEEAAIRANPAKRTTEILKRVFGRK